MLASFGHPEHGQLGNRTDGEFIAKQGKVSYDFVDTPTPIADFPADGAEIRDMACGTHHSLVLDTKGRVYTWGFGGYGRLGHGDAKDANQPEQVVHFTGLLTAPAGRVACGAQCCYVTTHVQASKGATYFWGKAKNTGEPSLRPTKVTDLQGWNVRSVDCGNTHTVVAADKSVISWGPSPTCGELGYGEGADVPKSSTVPRKVDSLEGVEVGQVATGYAHTVVVLTLSKQDLSAKKQLRLLPVLKDYAVAKPKAIYRGPSAYMMFARAQRKLLLGETEEASATTKTPPSSKKRGRKASPKPDESSPKKKKKKGAYAGKTGCVAIAKLCGERWGALSEEDKSVWELQYEEARKAAGFAVADEEGEDEGDGPKLSRAAKRRRRAASDAELEAADPFGDLEGDNSEDSDAEEDDEDVAAEDE